MKRPAALLISAVLFVGVLVLGVSNTEAQPACSVSSLKGTYGFYGAGFSQFGVTTANGPSVFSGFVTFDGAGGIVDGENRGNFPDGAGNYVIITQTVVPFPASSYVVDANCTGTFTVTATSSPCPTPPCTSTDTVALVVVDRGAEFFLTSLTPGAVFWAVGKQR